MFSKIWSWIVGEVRTVEHIIADLTNTAKELEAHAVAHLNVIEDLKAEEAEVDADYQSIKAEIASEVSAAEAEATKATAGATNIKNLIDPQPTPVAPVAAQ